MKKTVFIISALALLAACQKPANTEAPAQEPVLRTFTCTIAPPASDDPASKVAIADDGKSTWEVGDEILIHGEYTKSPYSTIVTLAAENISANGKTATFTISEITPYDRSSSGYSSTLYAAYPASAVLADDHCYWNTRFSSSNHPLMVGYNNGNNFVLHNVCGLITFKLTGDYDTYVLEGKNGETVGYTALQTRIRLKDDGTENLDGFPVRTGTGDSYTTVGTTSVSAAVTADGNTVNMISIPGGANFTDGFTIKFLKSGSVIKILSTKAVDLGYGKILPLGDITAYLKDYVAPATHDNEIGVDMASAIDLGASETANSYIVSAAGDYKFKAVKGNSSITLNGIEAVEILWETVNTTTAPEENSIIAAADYDQQENEDPYIVFKTPSTLKPGNALIAAKDAAGTILWSWHIWIPETAVVNITNAAFYPNPVMDRNLGALVPATTESLSIESYGMYYQWGRKDPFIGKAKAVGSAFNTEIGPKETAFSVQNPTVLITASESDSGGNWNSENISTLWEDNGDKAMYDPCPPGYKVPAYDPNTGLWTNDNTGWTYNWDNMYCAYGDILFPICGWMSNSTSLSYEGARVIIHSATAHSNPRDRNKIIRKDKDGFYYANYFKVEGATVRCVTE